MSNVDAKFQSVLGIISEHNTAIGGSGKPGYVDPDQFVECIKSVGGTSEDRLKRFSYEDILTCLPTFERDGRKIFPTVLAKEIAGVFRGKDETPEGGRRPIISQTRAEHMASEELVKAYDPTEVTNAVAKRLSAISKGEAFVVFESGRTVDVATTTKLLDEVKQGFQGRGTIWVGGQIKSVYKIGELPDVYAEENPLYPGRVLRPDGTCDQTGRSWDGVPLEVRQIVWLAVNTGELVVTIDTANTTIDTAIRPNYPDGSPAALNSLRFRYQKAAMRFEELAKTGDLPKLRIPMNSRSAKGSLRHGTKVEL